MYFGCRACCRVIRNNTSNTSFHHQLPEYVIIVTFFFYFHWLVRGRQTSLLTQPRYKPTFKRHVSSELISYGCVQFKAGRFFSLSGHFAKCPRERRVEKKKKSQKSFHCILNIVFVFTKYYNTYMYTLFYY